MTAALHADEVKASIPTEENAANNSREKEGFSEEKGQNHKCSISTMLNDEPVTPPHVRSKNIELMNQDISAEGAFDESSE